MSRVAPRARPPLVRRGAAHSRALGCPAPAPAPGTRSYSSFASTPPTCEEDDAPAPRWPPFRRREASTASHWNTIDRCAVLTHTADLYDDDGRGFAASACVRGGLHKRQAARLHRLSAAASRCCCSWVARRRSTRRSSSPAWACRRSSRRAAASAAKQAIAAHARPLRRIFSLETKLQALVLGKLGGVDVEDVRAELEAAVAEEPCVIYSYGLSPFSTEALALLDETGAKFENRQLGLERGAPRPRTDRRRSFVRPFVRSTDRCAPR